VASVSPFRVFRVFRGLRDGQAKVDPQHLGIQEQQRVEGLVLRAGRNLSLHREVREELLNALVFLCKQALETDLGLPVS